MTSDDPRAKYRHLPTTPTVADMVASIDPRDDVPDDSNYNDGARPYLRMTFGPWAR